MIIKICL